MGGCLRGIRLFLFGYTVEMTNMFTALGKAGRPFWFITGLALLCVVATLDHATGSELSFSLFYLIPIVIFSWAVGRNAGVTSAFVSAGIGLLIEVVSETTYSNAFVYLWNTMIHLGFFLLPALLLESIEREKTQARKDSLTGAFNNRFFFELMQMEADRSIRHRHPFTIAFIDLDNFKTVNDTFGHTFGDAVLRTIVECMKGNLRKTDIVARVGGDEFSILLPETGEEAAKIVIPNMQGKLMEEMMKNKWPITFSIGVVTLNRQIPSVDDIMGVADKMMYIVKNNGKNDIKYTTR
jgi:diguanylate cyclase (GGDEF)-like protein